MEAGFEIERAHHEVGTGGQADEARWYIGGLLHHAPSLLAFTNPTLKPGC